MWVWPIVVAWINLYVVIQFCYFLKQADVHVFGAASGKVRSAALAHEECVARQQFAVYLEADAVRSVSRGVDDLECDFAQADYVSVVDADVLVYV